MCVCVIGRTLALLLGFDLSGVGATRQRDTVSGKTGLPPRKKTRLNPDGVFNTAEKVMVEPAQENQIEEKKKDCIEQTAAV